jgi:nitroreductase
METERAFYMRRSVRKFRPEQVADAEMEKIVAAGETAPVAMGGHEKTHITVVRDPEVLEAVREVCRKESRKTPGRILDSLYGAQTLILVSAKDVSDDHIEYCNAACIIENMIIMASDLEIGSCYIWGALRRLRAAPEVMELLRLPAGFELLSGLVVGYPEKPLEERPFEQRIGLTVI